MIVYRLTYSLTVSQALSEIYGPISACVTMATYNLDGGEMSVSSRRGGLTDYLVPDLTKPQYASHLVEVCADLRELVLHLSILDSWEYASVH